MKNTRTCDICGKSVGVNSPYTTIKLKNYICCSAGGCSDNRKYDICLDCLMSAFSKRGKGKQ